MKARIATASALLVTALLVLTACVTPTGTDDDVPGAGQSSASVDANEEDREFATEMIVLQNQAIEASDTLLAKEGVDPTVSELAERIRAAQEPEIEQLESMLEEWGASAADTDAADTDEDDGISEEDIAALEAASAEEADRLYLEQMIEHHEETLEIAEEHAAEGRNADAIALSKKIVATQTLELERMNELLAGL